MEEYPIAQTIAVTLLPRGNYSITVQCCFCPKKHFHGAGAIGGDSLGTRMSHCIPIIKRRRGKLVQINYPMETYMVSFSDWIAKGSKVVRRRG